MIEPYVSLGVAINALTRQLASVGVDSPRTDARLLVEAATGLGREQLVLDLERQLSAVEAARLASLAQRRMAREPVTRILGERAFYGRAFTVTPATLDPRPETETLVELALELLRRPARPRSDVSILDIGTGTGCILLTLLAELAREGIAATGVGLDIDAGALEVARRNAARLELAKHCHWQLGSKPLAIADGQFDLVVSNPPYIPTADIAGLDPEVRLYDPLPALDGGPDGLALVREIVAASTRGSAGRNAWFALEIGAGQADAVSGLVSEALGPEVAGSIERRLDLGGHTRCVAWLPQFKAPQENLLATPAGRYT